MREYVITRISEKPDWEAIPRIATDNYQWCDDIGVRAWGQFAYDDRAIYARLTAREADIRATFTGDRHPVCQDSCLEWFFSPLPDDARYFNMEMNPNGAMYIGFGSGRKDLLRLHSDDWEAILSPRPFKLADGWGIEYRVPFEFIRRFFPDFKAQRGESIRANCYKCGDSTPRRHYITWNPIPSETPDFHIPKYFGTMYFG